MFSLIYVLIGEIFAIIIGVVYWRYLSRPYRMVLALAMLGLICEVTGFSINRFLHVGNAWLFNLYMPFEPALLSVASMHFINEKKYKKVVGFFILLNFFIWLSSILLHSIYVFANFAMICGCFLLVVVYIFVLFKNVLFESKVVVKDPLFWLCLSTILYFGCDIPYMGMYHYWMPFKLRIHLSNINQVLNFFRYPLVAVSFLLTAQERKNEKTV